MSWYNLFKTSDFKGIISFDFDATLTQPVYDSDNEIWVNAGPRHEIIDKMKQYSNGGYEIIVVTSRYDFDIDEVREFVKKYELPVSRIYGTSGEPKGPLLEYLGVEKHFDDCPNEIQSAQEYNVKAERVWHPRDLETGNEIDE